MTEQPNSPTNINPTNVNPFNGISDPEKAAAVAQELFEKGAFNADGRPDAEQKAAQAPEKEAPAEPPAWHESYEAMERAEQFAEASRAQKASQVHQALQVGQQAHQQLIASAQGVDWDRLRAENPDAYEALRADYEAKDKQIKQHLSDAHSQAHGLASEYLAVEREKALRLIPEWRDKKVFEASKEEMLDYARRHGISQAEVESIIDHRHLVALYHASQSGKAPPPKSPGVKLRPVNVKGQVPRELRPLAAARSRFADDPRDADAQSAYAQRLLDAGA